MLRRQLLPLATAFCMVGGYVSLAADDGSLGIVQVRVGQSTSRARVAAGVAVAMSSANWKGVLFVEVRPSGSRLYRLETSFKVDGQLAPATSVELGPGQVIELVDGKDVPRGFFGREAKAELSFAP